MSAMNLIQQTDAVHLISDGARYERDGTVLGFLPKTFVLEKARSAIGIRGRTPHIAPEDLLASANFDEVLRALPDVVRSMQNMLHENEPDENFEPFRNFECVAIGWSDIRDQPEAWGISTQVEENSDMFSNVPDFKPFKVFELPLLIAAPGVSLSSLFGELGSMEDVDALDPRAAGRAILEAQRRTAYEFDGANVHCVGGYGEITSVTRSGVGKQRLVDWPDVIGQKIKPS